MLPLFARQNVTEALENNRPDSNARLISFESRCGTHGRVLTFSFKTSILRFENLRSLVEFIINLRKESVEKNLDTDNQTVK
jgi:hypothetical protein